MILTQQLKIFTGRVNTVISRDFNFNLLKSESHSDTENAFNLLGSFSFQSHILQPTRITDHPSYIGKRLREALAFSLNFAILST